MVGCDRLGVPHRYLMSSDIVSFSARCARTHDATCLSFGRPTLRKLTMDVGIHTDMCIDQCIDLCTDASIDMCADMCVDVCRNV